MHYFSALKKIVFIHEVFWLMSHQIATQTLWSIRIIVLAKPEHENRISHIFCHYVKTGIANTLGMFILTKPNETVKCNPHNCHAMTRICPICVFCIFQEIKEQWECRLCLMTPLLDLLIVT